MTIQEFFKQLSELPVPFFLTPDREIRTCYGKTCPIVSLANFKNAIGVPFYNSSAMAAGHALGLINTDINRIVSAADFDDCNAYDPNVREALLKSCDLKIQPEAEA